MRRCRVRLALVGLCVAFMISGTSAAAENLDEQKTAAEYLFHQNIMVGNQDGDMCLDSLLTRAELAVILSRLTVNQEHLSAEREFYAGECQFADVPDWAAVYVGYCAFNGFMVGYGDDIFGASDPVTPAAACTIILRYLDLPGTPAEYDTACKTAYELSLIPQDTAQKTALTRGELAVILYRTLRYEGQPDLQTSAEEKEKTEDDSRYIPQVGDVIRCGDGSDYTITDVSRYDANMFADGPLGPLPEPTCDWSQFDQPELPAAEARRFQTEAGDYLFLRNLYETRRMLYTLYNAMGENEATWANGSAVLREDGTPWVHIELTMPEDLTAYPFWPWREDQVTAFFHSRPGGTFYLEVWDVFADGIFQRTEYNIRAR